jgi:hypothetical protein
MKNFYLVTTTGHGLFGAHYYAFTSSDVVVVQGFVVAATVCATLFISAPFRRAA